jgi:hypothetical protein
MKRFVKLSEVKKSLRRGCQLNEEKMALLSGGEDNTSTSTTTTTSCPYQFNPETCQFLVNGYCTLDQICKDIIIYSAVPPDTIGG